MFENKKEFSFFFKYNEKELTIFLKNFSTFVTLLFINFNIIFSTFYKRETSFDAYEMARLISELLVATGFASIIDQILSFLISKADSIQNQEQ